MTREPRYERLYDMRTTLVVAATFATAILVAVVALATLGDHPFRYYSIDPSSTLGGSPLVGLMSHTGVLLGWGAALICVFAGAFVARARGWRTAAPLLLLGVGVSYLSIDDLFMFHESIYPEWLMIPQKLVLGVYAAVAVAFFWSYRDFFRQHESRLLTLALGLLATAILLDLDVRELLVHDGLKRWMEDGTKLFGLVFFAAYLIRLSARMLVEAYPLAASDESERTVRPSELSVPVHAAANPE